MCRRVGNFLQQYVLDPFYYARTWLTNAVVWSAIRLTAYEIPFEVIKKKTKPNNRQHQDLNLDTAQDLDGLSKHAEAQLKEATARRALVTDKCKTLFTFNTALLALIAVFQGKIIDLTSWEIALFYIAVVAFVVALLVLWTYFDVSGEMVISMDQGLVGLDKANVQKSLINSNLNCATEMDNRTDYLVDLYRTSRFYLMVGFVLLFVVFSHSYFARAGVSDTDKVFNKLREDPKFKDMVRDAK
jgi:hypothetical protein